jgi:GNAT superfamily N-acetyltransferase
MNYSIELATINDIPSMVELLNELFTQDIEFIPNNIQQQKGLELILNNPEIGELFLLKTDNKTVGMVSLLYSISTALGGKVAILEDMIITKKHQGNGLGSRLLNYAIDFARKRNCMRITLLTDYDNERAIGFYKKSNFIKSQMIPMRLLL